MTQSLAGCRVLIVEDSPTQAVALAVLLEEAGAAVEMARSGEEALDVTSRAKVDLIVSDVVMPGLTGYELCTELKSRAATRGVPVILLTSLANPLEIMRALACGADNFVNKPYDNAVLLNRAARAIERRRHPARDDASPIEVNVLGSRFDVTASRSQILELLVSNFEELVRSNADLRAARADAEAARQRAEDANKAKSDFLAMMSHDLRTPLNAIGGYSELLAMGVRGELNEAQQRDLDRIRRNQKYLLSLVNDVLSFARIEQGDIPLKLERLRLEDVVRPLGAMIEPQTMARNLRYRYETVNPDVFVCIDRERLEQIVVNLLGNATKFTLPGGEIVMRSGRRNGEAFVTIEDTGIGIPAAKLPTIFDPFVQVDQSNIGKREGVGLGLAISRKLARLMNGELSAESELGKGSRFTIAFPAA